MSKIHTNTTARTNATPFLLTRRGFTLAAMSSAVLAACGGGGGGGIAGISTGGTGSFSSGTVRGFGSIIVNGVRYDDSRASVFGDDGVAVGSSAVRLGMVVEVNGGSITTDAAGVASAIANSVAIRSEIKGPVSAVSGNTLTILGQQISVTASTVFDDNVGGLATVRVNDVLEVYGLFVSAGNYNATRVERVAGVNASFKLRGVVSNLNATNRTFNIGTVAVGYTAITPSFTLQNGQFVRATLSLVPGVNGVYQATSITNSATLAAAAASGLEAEVEGYVTSFTSASSFSVNGVPVDARNATRTPTTGLVLGAEVEVSGTVQNGVLVAREVKLESASENERFEVKGTMTLLNTQARTFVVRGVTVNYASATFTRGTAATLANGQTVEAKGVLGTDRVTLVASEVKIDN